MDIKKLINQLGFTPRENVAGIFIKKYQLHSGYAIEVDFNKESINYGNLIGFGDKSTQNFSKAENFVVLECVNRLLEKGYKPKNIFLEKIWPAGHRTSGKLDICVKREDGSEYLLIECKTYGKEFDKEFAKMKKDGGQLFTYFKFSNKADVIMLYASELKGKEIVYKNEIVKIEEDYRVGDVKDFYEKWSKLTKNNGVFDSWVKPYSYESKALTISQLKAITQEDSSFIFNRFLEILRHNVVSDKGNAFNKIFTLFLCKVYDETSRLADDTEPLDFQWIEGKDDDISFQLRLTNLYKAGMKKFLDKTVSDFDEEKFKNQSHNMSEETKKYLLAEMNKIRLEKNNEFAIKEVYDNHSFIENARVVKEVVELLQGFRIRYNKRQQYLSDFFELLLTTGLKQESGQFFTPVPVAQFIIKSLPIKDLVLKKLENRSNDILPYMIDYAAGSGHFITEYMHDVQKIIQSKEASKYIDSTAKKIKHWQGDHFDWATEYVYGIEKDYRLVKVGKVGCYLHGDGLANVILSDGLANFTDTTEYKGKLIKERDDNLKDHQQFDVVLSNPPYSVSSFKQTTRSYYTERDFELYDALTDNSSEIECLFVERTKHLLKDGGVAGVILPSSILHKSGIYKKTRELILQYFEIIAIAELGKNTFMATETSTVVLFLRRRNNYHGVNIRQSVEKFFNDYIDVTINGIEKPVAKYASYVWGELSFDDYISLLNKKPNDAVKNSEIYQEYRNKIKEKIEKELKKEPNKKGKNSEINQEYSNEIKAKIEKEFWQSVIEREIDKIYHFILAYKQQVVLVRTGKKKSEKRFLGYEFSGARGKEGIHSIRQGKQIDECTKLFNPNIFDDPSKASTYIYEAFNGNFDRKIDESLQDNISRVDLVDMMIFDRTEFEKTISLNAKKKVKIESKWEFSKLVNLIYENPKSRIKVNSAKEIINGKYLFFTSGESILKYNEYLVNDENIFISTGGNASVKFYNGNASYSTDTFVIKSNNDNLIKTKYIYYLLQSIIKEIDEVYFKGVGLKHLQKTEFTDLKIPLPTIDVQEKIVAEIEKIEENESKVKDKIEESNNKIISIINDTTGVYLKLQDLTTKIGSGATPRGGESSYIENGISLIRSQNIYDSEFREKGLVFIDNDQATKLNNVTVERYDILFNITGASVCRCCIVDESYLPARVNQHVSIIRANNKILPLYLQKVLVNPRIKNQLLSMAEGSSTREAITKNQLEEFKIPLPPITEQEKIVVEIEELEKQIAEAQKIVDSSLELKNAVLRKYL